MTAFAASNNAFGLDLWKRLPAAGNQVFSPASITTALAMTWGGAKGETALEMRKTLHFTDTPAEVMAASGRLSSSLTDPQRPIVFRIANRLFCEASFCFEPPFLAATKAAYGAPLESVDFAAAPEKYYCPPRSTGCPAWRRRSVSKPWISLCPPWLPLGWR